MTYQQFGPNRMSLCALITYSRTRLQLGLKNHPELSQNWGALCGQFVNAYTGHLEALTQVCGI